MNTSPLSSHAVLHFFTASIWPRFGPDNSPVTALHEIYIQQDSCVQRDPLRESSGHKERHQNRKYLKCLGETIYWMCLSMLTGDPIRLAKLSVEHQARQLSLEYH